MSREITRTKKQIVSDLSVETEPEKQNPAPAASSAVPDESNISMDAVKTENPRPAAAE